MSGTPQAGVIGLSNLTYWPLTSDPATGTPTYGAAVSLPGIAELNFDPKASQTPFFGDNTLIAVGSTTGFRTLGAKLYDIDPQSLATLMGQTYANGQILDQGNDISPYFALAGKVLRNSTTGGVPTQQYVVFYKVQFMKPKSDWKTKADKVTFIEVSLDGSAVALTCNGQYGLMQRADDPNGSAAALTAWFTTVQFNGADNSALSVVFAAGGTTKTITATFSKASTSGSIPFTMASASTLTALANEVLFVNSTTASVGVAVPATWVLTTPGAGFSNNTIVFTGTLGAGAVAGNTVTAALRSNSTVVDNNGTSATGVGKGTLTLA
jgi:phi13 family phage major tail protein